MFSSSLKITTGYQRVFGAPFVEPSSAADAATGSSLQHLQQLQKEAVCASVRLLAGREGLVAVIDEAIV